MSRAGNPVFEQWRAGLVSGYDRATPFQRQFVETAVAEIVALFEPPSMLTAFWCLQPRRYPMAVMAGLHCGLAEAGLLVKIVYVPDPPRRWFLTVERGPAE